ncbi:MAG: hypothetical protein AB7F96_20425 [Beijerinckiaceae bacterium]
MSRQIDFIAQSAAVRSGWFIEQRQQLAGYGQPVNVVARRTGGKPDGAEDFA